MRDRRRGKKKKIRVNCIIFESVIYPILLLFRRILRKKFSFILKTFFTIFSSAGRCTSGSWCSRRRANKKQVKKVILILTLFFCLVEILYLCQKGPREDAHRADVKGKRLSVADYLQASEKLQLHL